MYWLPNKIKISSNKKNLFAYLPPPAEAQTKLIPVLMVLFFTYSKLDPTVHKTSVVDP